MSADWISSWWTVAGLGLVTLGLMTFLVLRRRAFRAQKRQSEAPVRRPWPHKLITLGMVFLVVICTMATGLIAVNAYAGFVPGTGSLPIALRGWGVLPSDNKRWNPEEIQGDATHGTVRSISIPASPEQKMSGRPAWIYTPPGYNPHDDQRYAVVYFAHGSPGRASDFFTGGDAANTMDVLIEHGEVPPMIMVAFDENGTGPSADDTECLDSTTGGSLVESYITKNVVSWVDENMKTVPDRDHRIIGGMSAGGFCALNVGLRNLDIFSTILALIPYTEPGNAGPLMLSSAQEIAANSPESYIPTMEFTHPVRVFVDGGTDAAGKPPAHEVDLVKKLMERKQEVKFRSELGQGHNWAMVKVGLPYALQFAGETVTKVDGHD